MVVIACLYIRYPGNKVWFEGPESIFHSFTLSELTNEKYECTETCCNTQILIPEGCEWFSCLLIYFVFWVNTINRKCQKGEYLPARSMSETIVESSFELQQLHSSHSNIQILLFELNAVNEHKESDFLSIYIPPMPAVKQVKTSA